MTIDEITEIGGKECPGLEYSPVVLETYYEAKSGKSSRIHARPVKGQKYFPAELDAECCRDMRKKYPVGTVFLVWGKITDREGSGEFIYTYHGWPYEIIQS